MKRNKNKKGFTIVELVIVIGVIGILSAILIPTFVSLTDRANEARLKSELANAYSAYAADAADGKVDEGAHKGETIAFKKQADVKLASASNATTGYAYTTDGWAVTASDLSGYTLVIEQAYNGYYVFAVSNS